MQRPPAPGAGKSGAAQFERRGYNNAFIATTKTKKKSTRKANVPIKARVNLQNLHLHTECERDLAKSQHGRANLAHAIHSRKRGETNSSIEGQHSLLDNMKIIAQSSLRPSPGERPFGNHVRPKSSAPTAGYCRSRKNN